MWSCVSKCEHVVMRVLKWWKHIASEASQQRDSLVIKASPLMQDYTNLWYSFYEEFPNI